MNFISPAEQARPSTWKRSSVVAVLAGIGGLLFLPLMFADDPTKRIPALLWFVFPTASAAVSAGLAVLGFRWSDVLRIPMPVLRPWEAGQKVSGGAALRLFAIASVSGAALGFAGLEIVRGLGVPENPGTLAVRAASTLFAAVVTETVTHLFLLTGLLMLWRRSAIPALIVSSIAFVAIFHGQTPGLTPSLSAALLAMNFVMALAFGFMFLKTGFEAAVVTHGFAHLILLSFS